MEIPWYIVALVVLGHWGIIAVQRTAYRTTLDLYQYRLARAHRALEAARMETPEAEFEARLEAVMQDIERRKAQEERHRHG